MDQVPTPQELKANFEKNADLACNTAEEFIKFFYESLDKKRMNISRLYMDTAIFTWNGNCVKGNEEIQKFWTDFAASDHTVVCLDAQPIIGSATKNQLTFLVKVGGHVKYDSRPAKAFNQTFLLTALGDKWKIVSDCFRTQEDIE